MDYINYRSKGNSIGLEETINDFWEIDSEGYVIRSIEVQPDGQILKYNEIHDADSYSILPEGVITEENLQDRSVGTCLKISKSEFEKYWKMTAINWNP